MTEKEYFSDFGRSSNQEDVSNGKFDNQTNSSTNCDVRFKPPHCDFVERTVVDNVFTRNIEPKYDYSPSESDDSDTEEGGALKRSVMFQDLSLDSNQNLYQSFSWESKKKLTSREFSNGICSKDKRVSAVKDTDNDLLPPDDDDEVSKKIESRLWFFNAVSKSNCCDCYKKGHESENIKEEIMSCPEYKRIKETEEYTNYIKECMYTSLLKGNVRKNEECLVDYLPKIDEMDEDEEMWNEKDENEECTVDALEVNGKTTIVDCGEDPVDGNRSESGSPISEPKQTNKRFKGLRKFFARIFCCTKKPSEADI